MRKNLLNVTYTIMFMIFSFLIPHSYSLKTTFENLINSEDSVILKIEFDTIQEMIQYLDKKIIEINFDDEKLSYNKLDYIGSLRKQSVTTDRQPNKLNISLRANKDYKKLKYKLDTPNIIEAKFKIIDKNIPICETPITVNSVDSNKKTIKPIYETSLKIGNPEYETSLKINNPEIDKCKLKNLIPDIGTLSPNFDPEIYEYDMIVDSDIKFLNFEAIPTLEHLDVRIAHRYLSAPGKYTDVTITVANPDLKLKETYTVHVYRKLKFKITFLQIGNPDVDKCKLKNLIPDIGILNPNFDPEIYEYDMIVDSDIKSLDFEAIPMLEHLDVKISHRNFSAPGKYTDVTIIVENPNLKLKETYTVHIYRE